jgi:predicted enzyme related to lactoylglutathione lyase
MRVEQVKFMLMAADMDRGIAFYRDVIGLKPAFTSPYWSELLFGDAIVALHGGGNGEFNPTGLSFQVEDVEAACREVEAGGGTIRMAPESRPGEPIKLAHVTDPEGNGIGLTQFIGG